MTPSGSNADRPPLAWPKDTSLSESEAVVTRCARCEQSWQIHRDLCGYRLRCVCTGWVRVPYAPVVIETSEAVASARVASTPTRPALAPPDSRTPASGTPDSLTSTPAPAPAPRVRGSAAIAGARERSLAAAEIEDVFPPLGPGPREIDRGILEIVALVIAFIAPGTVVALLAGVDVFMQWLPVVSLASGVLVLLVGIASGQFGLEALRGARPKYFVEGVLAAFIGVGLAWGWTAIAAGAGIDMESGLVSLVDTLGLPLSLFAIALCPAVFEELAFRGIIQGRLIGLLGKGTAIPLTAALFMLAHGVSAASPIHLILGIELGYLRQRSGSLYPGMILHGLYNGTLVATSV